MEELRKWVWCVTLAFGLLLSVTGVWLSFAYRPSPMQPGHTAAVLPVLLAVCLAALRRRSSTVAPTGA